MENIVWKEEYKIGVDFIDKEHKLLFSTMNKLLKISEDEKKSVWACQEGVKYLKNHTLEHFEHEEEYMRSIDYSEYEIHKRLHDNFRYKTLPALEKEMVETEFSTDSIRHFLGVCIGWVVAHTQTEDQAISGKTVSKWTDIPHEKEKEALEQTITQVIHDIFHLDAKLISEQYTGENFGDVVCCRFVYRGQQKEQWGVTLVFEEHMLLQVIGNILKTQYQKVDDMVINVTRYLARQFLDRIRESFPSIDLYELEKECLLTQEQLVDLFERSHPPCSLLFDTGIGYFAFSAASTDSLRGRIGSSVDPQNAMHSIKQYLNQDKSKDAGQKDDTAAQAKRKRILVVDDSDFMRGRIVKLLESDYEMLEANSSLTAIKSLTANRPDLIILDYEMPVCDGRQALEMIRAEKDIADIPVIFLTGRGDRESVQKVMELKPERYLLKTMSDDDVKKSINDFFEKRKK